MLVEKKYHTGDVELNYAEGPKSGPPLLLLHGNSWRWQSYLSIMPFLTQRWHVYAIDFRGHGSSGRTDTYSLNMYLEDTKSFVENIVKEDLVIFGHSMGAAVAFLLAADMPNLVKGIIIGDITIDFASMEQQVQAAINSGTFKVWSEWAKEDKSSDSLLSKLLKHQIPIPNSDQTIAWGDAPGSIPWLLFLAQNLTKLDHKTQAGASNIEAFRIQWKIYDSTEFLQKIKCPTLLLQADSKLGGMMTDKCVKMAKEKIEIVVHKKIEEVGHGLFYSDVTAVMPTVIDFLELVRD